LSDPDTPHGQAEPDAPPRIARRGLVLGGVAVVTGAAIFGANWFNIAATDDREGSISAPEAFADVQAGLLTLVDIRRPDEWAQTGVGQGAVLIDMLRDDFEEALFDTVSGDRAARIAMICARGVRSRGMARQLKAAGYTNIVDISEGMLGSGAGPGWIKRGLPVVDAS